MFSQLHFRLGLIASGFLFFSGCMNQTPSGYFASNPSDITSTSAATTSTTPVIQASSICSGTTINGVVGVANCSPLESSANRDVGSTQISVLAETTTYAGSSSTPDLPSNYRDVPDFLKDDDAYANEDQGCTSNCTHVQAITLAQHRSFIDCGTTQNSISERIADCISKNGALATWNGQTSGGMSQGSWNLVTRTGSYNNYWTNSEVWRDQRTGLVWSSALNPGSSGDNWCLASGNGQANDGICGSPIFQPQLNSNKVESECAEVNPGYELVPVPGWCSDGNAYASAAGCTGAGGSWIANAENYAAGNYSAAKGGMGANSSAKVRWRLPTMSDWEQAEVDGVRSVMPDLGTLTRGYHWSATMSSRVRDHAWIFNGDAYNAFYDLRTNSSFGGMGSFSSAGVYLARCVGR